MNASTSKSKYEEEIQIAINKVLDDINAIKAMNSPYSETLIEKYVETLSVDEVKNKLEELETAASRAGLNINSLEVASVKEAKPVEIKTNEAEGINVKVYANQNQMRQICDFMKAIGVRYEM